jgi:hypothetical protein
MNANPNHHDNGDPGAKPDTATDAYARHLRRCAAMADWIEAELEAHRERAAAQPRNWGLVGDLAEMENLLKRALGHVSGMDEGAIDEALDEREEA